jgi:hypothetical protein
MLLAFVVCLRNVRWLLVDGCSNKWVNWQCRCLAMTPLYPEQTKTLLIQSNNSPQSKAMCVSQEPHMCKAGVEVNCELIITILVSRINPHVLFVELQPFLNSGFNTSKSRRGSSNAIFHSTEPSNGLSSRTIYKPFASPVKQRNP